MIDALAEGRANLSASQYEALEALVSRPCALSDDLIVATRCYYQSCREDGHGR